MEYGYCSTTLIPCRAEASDKSEQINQLLFGETYEVLETGEKWIRIKTRLDNYESWIDKKLHSPLSLTELEGFESSKKRVVQELLFPVMHLESNTTVLLAQGSILPEIKDGGFNIGPNSYTISQQNHVNIDLAAFSKSFLNAPYLWGGKSIFGADCSGFTQVVFRAFDKWIPRDAYQQAELGTKIELEDVRSGDLAFFGKPDGKITHVGICLDHGKIIHCSGKCRIDTLDEKGIYNAETDSYSHDLRLIKRL